MFVLASIKFFIAFRNTNVHESCIRSQNERFYHACNIFQKIPLRDRNPAKGPQTLLQKMLVDIPALNSPKKPLA